MLLLYYGAGSREVQLVRQKNSTVWGLVKTQTVRFLRMDGSPDSAEILEKTPFELWDGTNGFGDDFELLYFKPTLEKFLELRLDAQTEANRLRYRRIADALKEMNNPIRFIAVDVNADDMEGVPTPELQITSATVERALIDFETLARSANGAVSGVDRVHTALHGYLIEVCKEAGISHADDADITALFSLIRQHHPKLQNHPPGIEAQKVLRGMAQIVDAMNPVRNHKSMAHPTDDLLEEPEAMLAANAIRSLLHYLNMKLR
ncbi:MAG: abortive infection family protein [Acidobacteriia bacterium]|nr:abortive infection family protein [Terriglobia bacterium]